MVPFSGVEILVKLECFDKSGNVWVIRVVRYSFCGSCGKFDQSDE